MILKDIFHVHTYRCGHASMCEDETYVKKAMELKARSIWFTDHAPFPGDPFRNHMKYDQLDEYLSSLTQLKNKYTGIIDIHVGLEIEYIPSYDIIGYYRSLKKDPRIEILLLGQHFAEANPGEYTNAWPLPKRREEEFLFLGNAIIQGIKTGYFNILAHPDRIFKRSSDWNDKMKDISLSIISTAIRYDIPMEINMTSVALSILHRAEFWELVPREAKVIIGLDAHFPQDLEPLYTRGQAYAKQLI